MVAAVCVTTAAVMKRRFLIGLWQYGGQARGFVFCMGAISMMKIWYWMEMQRIGVTREIKRLELQVACLTQRLTEDNPRS